MGVPPTRTTLAPPKKSLPSLRLTSCSFPIRWMPWYNKSCSVECEPVVGNQTHHDDHKTQPTELEGTCDKGESMNVGWNNKSNVLAQQVSTPNPVDNQKEGCI